MGGHNQEQATLNIGYWNSVYFNGTIDEVRVFNHTLSSEQITALYNNRSDLIVSQETAKGENWSLCVTPNDASADGPQACSNQLLIRNAPPSTPTLLYPADGNQSVFERNITFDWDSSDPDGDSIDYTFNLTQATCADDLQENLTGSGHNSSELCVDRLYEWRVQACDAELCSPWSDTWNFTVASVLGLRLDVNNTNFGTLARNATANTTDGDPAPFQVNNTGNIRLNVTIKAENDLFTTSGLGNSSWQYKARENEAGAFNATGSATAWTNMSAAAETVIAALFYGESRDAAYIDILLDLPPGEPAGYKSATVNVTGVAGE